jgi:transposase
MAMGRRQREAQQDMWIASEAIVKGPGHPFYARLEALLVQHGFDRFVEDQCARFYAEDGRPGVPPGVYFRMLMVGYFESIDSERGIAWRCADSLTLREFLGYDVRQASPDHSTLSVIRGRIDQETHQEVFGWALGVLKEHGLLDGTTVGIDSTTLEANAALRSIVQRHTQQTYHEFLESLARASGIDTPTREDLARLDRERKGKGSNDHWHNPHDPDAKITRMKDGRTHLAHKVEHAVDMTPGSAGATLAVTVQPADRGDTQSVAGTLREVMENLSAIPEEAVLDKGYHSNDVLSDLREMGVRSYISEPKRGRRCWKDKSRERDAVYANRRRIRGARGKRLLRKRGELLERPFAHHYRAGGLRRMHLRGHGKIIKRLLAHAMAGNLGLLMRRLIGIGTPRGLHGAAARLQNALRQAPANLIDLLARIIAGPTPSSPIAGRRSM